MKLFRWHILLTVYVCFLCGAQCQQVLGQAQYTVIDLGTLGGPWSQATALNNLSQVAGISGTANNQTHAFLYSNGQMVDISSGSIVDQYQYQALGINDSSDVVGYRRSSSGLPDFQGFLYHNGVMSFLQTPHLGEQSIAKGINNQGTIVGETLVGTGELRQQATIWNKGIPTDFGMQINPLGFGLSTFTGINNAGLVIGSVVRSAFFWQAGNAQFLTGNNLLYAINATGTAAGIQNPNTTPQAITVTGEKVTVLPTPAGEYTEAYGINNAGKVVGLSYKGYAFLFDGVKVWNLNSLIPAGSGWNLATAVAINDQGEIAGTGTLNGQTHAFLLTPFNTYITNQALILTADYPGGGIVDGIVCDNLRAMDPAIKDRIKVTLASIPGVDISNADFQQTQVVGTNPGCIESHHGYFYYYPPDEYNENPEPDSVDQVTKSATRRVMLQVRFKVGNQSYIVDPKTVVLARPPVVLVHGINSNPTRWNPLTVGISSQEPVLGLGIHVPFVAVNHNNSYRYGNLSNGNGPVEIGAALLSDQILTVLNQARNGQPIKDGPVSPNDPFSSFNQFEDYTNYFGPNKPGLHLAIRRVDVVAWSYGGVITRWYIASRGSNESYSWYQREETLPASRPMPNFTMDGSPIRKVITLGSMWRGVPLVNYLNEANFTSTKTTIQMKNAPLLTPAGNFTIGDVVNLLPIPTKVPSMEVMATNSKWMSQLVFGAPSPGGKPTPFNPNIAYGSVAGDNNNYPIEIPSIKFVGSLGTLHLDIYGMLNYYQLPSYFPYLPLETRGDASRNFSDGLVPLWSAAIPGSYKIAPTTHDAYPSDQDTREYVIQYLNHAGLPLGKILNDTWNDPSKAMVNTEDNAVTWSFQAGEMAPYPQSDFYKQIDGIGRINPYTLGKPSIIVPVIDVKLSRVENEIIANVTITNGGYVLIPDVQITNATLICGSNIGLPSGPIPQKLGTLNLLKSVSTSLRFPGSVGMPGTRAKLVIQGMATLDTLGSTLRVTLP